MIFTMRMLALAATGVAGAACTMGMAVPAVSSQAATTTLCQTQTLPVASGACTVQNNEWGSSAPECITTQGPPLSRWRLPRSVTPPTARRAATRPSTEAVTGAPAPSWYLVDVEAGFELRQIGAGLAARSFSVRVGGGK